MSWRHLSLLLEVNEAVGFVLILLDAVGDHKQGLILVVLEGNHLHCQSAGAPADHHALLLQVLHLLGQKVDVRDVVSLYITNRGCLYPLDAPHQQHPLPQFIEALEIENTLTNGLDEIFPLEDVGRRDILCDCLEIDGFVEDQRAEAEHIEGRLSFLGLDIASQNNLLGVMDVADTEDIDSAVVDDDQLAFSSLLDAEGLFRLIDAADELQCYFILEVDSEMCEKEDALLDDFHIGLQDELLLEG